MAEDAGEVRDASRRTYLANERTYLAWWRTGLTCMAVGAAAGKVIPELSSKGSPSWPYVASGIYFTVLGGAFIVYARIRHNAVRAAVAEDRFSEASEWALVGFTVLGVLGALGLALALLLY